MAQVKANNNDVMMRLLKDLKEEEQKPLLLLHVCCAPCSTAVLERLADTFRIILFFDNPNLDTAEEHSLRAGEAARLAEESGWAEQVIISPYDPKAFRDAVKGLEHEPEGGARCEACFRLRLSRSSRTAAELHCSWFTTTLSVSPQKDAALLNHLGVAAGEAAGVPFLPSDFKKRGGYQRSVALSRQFGLYRQDYCGCAFSRRDKN
jgi:predicted adenine nucleotide alpha hydrolase (AANH) superfamily ATPase